MVWAIRASSALYGLALAIALAPRLALRAGPHELPGALAAEGLSARGPLLQWIALVLFTFLGAVAAGPLIAKLRESRWAAVCYCIATASAIVPMMHFGELRHVILHGLVAAAIVAARRIDPQFSREDVVLLPVLLSTYLALLDTGFGRTPSATFLRATMIVFALRLIARSPRPLMFAPLALLFQIGWIDRPVAGVLALAWIFVSAFVPVRPSRRLLTYLIYPIAFPAYALALLGIFSAPLVDFFEDGHDLLPAGEMLRGEVAYRDVVPMHGLISDGGLSWLVLSTGNDSVDSALAVRRVISAFNLAVIYFLVLAATGSAEAGALASLLAIVLFPSTAIFLRPMPALGALAAACAAVRLRSRRWLIAAAALCAFSFLVSIDFAIYSTLVVIIAAVRMRAFAVAGGSAVAMIIALFAFWPVLAESTVFVIARLAPPDCLHNLSSMAAFSSDPHCFSAIVWVLALIAAAVGLAASPLRSSRRDAALLVSMWVVVVGLSYVERRHFYYEVAVAALLIVWLWQLRRARYAIALMVLVAVLARPFSHVFDIATNMRRAAEVPANGVAELPRTRGARFEEHVRRGLDAASQFKLTRNGTWLDFANAPLLYYVMDRDCPIRWVEVPLYESEERQREVIAILERDRRIEAVLISFPGDFSNIDGVSNRDRAPLVWKFIETNFAPSFDEAGVEFWRRRR